MDYEAWTGVVGIIVKSPSSTKINWNNAEFKKKQKKFWTKRKIFDWAIKKRTKKY